MGAIPMATTRVVRALLGAALVTALLPALQVATTSTAAAATPLASGAITLHVQSARSVNLGTGFVHKGDAVTSYKWLINKDDTGDPGTSADQGTATCLPTNELGVANSAYDPNNCPWPSVRATSGFAPIVAQGDETTLAAAPKVLSGLPGGKYLISVTADGFKIDGAHFTVNGGTQNVTVEMNPTPLPLSTLRIEVFNDNAPVDATYEVDAERGLAGFVAHLSDVFGPVSVDYYGNALCTKYLRVQILNGVTSNVAETVATEGLPIAFDANNKPIVDSSSTGVCTSDANGLIKIPNMGPNRMAATITPPVPAAGQTFQYVQTTTLEGGHDHDIWSQEGATGFDTEQTKGAELVPSVQFGFVKTQALSVPAVAPTGEIKGVAVSQLTYIGGKNGQVAPQTNLAGATTDGPIVNPWVALSDLNRGDQQVYVGRGAADGTFDIKNVPDGTYQLSLWDDPQDYILWSFNVEVKDGALTDVGQKAIVGWFTHMHGHVFIDANGNGKRDSGERGVPGFALTIRERDNTLMDQASNTVTTNDSGAYDIAETYPMGKFLVMEAFNTRYQTTGITYQADNEPTATTKLGAGVDLSFLPIIGLGSNVDWGVQPYAPNTNGGIVGTISYDTTRNELDAAQAASESYQPGIPDMTVRLYQSVPCSVTDPALVANQCRLGKEIVPLSVPDPADPTLTIINPDPNRGALVHGPEVIGADPLNPTSPYTSETYSPPSGCTARQYDGTILTGAEAGANADQLALPPAGNSNYFCVEAPMLGSAVGPGDDTPGAFGQTVNGNYGFGDLTPGDYIVAVDIPNNPVGGGKMYKATSEADVNVFDGDSYLPQSNFPPASPAIAGDPPAGAQPVPTPVQPPSQQAGIISPCAGPMQNVHVTNPAFVAGGGSPFEGQDKPSCTDKLVTVRNGQATAPNFNLFTDVPLPTHFWGLTLNDLGISLDRRSANYGEAQGIPNVPVGLYDSFGRLTYTTHTDYNGLYEALVPSTDTFNCPVPAGPCPNMYRFVGNDPGQPGALNADYNPRFRTIATNFQAWPGLYTVTDEAPTQVAATVLTPDTTVANRTICDLAANSPQIFAVDRPYIRQPTLASPDPRTVTVKGVGFGATPGVLKVNDTVVSVTAPNWSDTSITFTVPATIPVTTIVNGLPVTTNVPFNGALALSITNTTSKLFTYNGLTIQALGAFVNNTRGQTTSNPQLAEVGPGKQYSTIQAALNAALPTGNRPYWLVVVWPGTPTVDGPRGEYTENVIVHHQVHLQGVGPGGFQGTTYVPGSIIDGSAFNPDNPDGIAWIALLGSLAYSGNAAVPDAAAVTVLHGTSGPNLVPSTYALTIDGFTITGGAQSNVGVNANIITGGIKTPYGATGALITQGGGVYVHNNVAGLQLTDNVIVGNGGSYGGGVRVGTPYVTNNRNTDLKLSRNQIRDNGGTNLAGGVGIFAGSAGYSVDHNAICGNHSSEYGGAISAFGYNGSNGLAATGNSIDHNRIWFNQSYDEGGGIMVAGELPADPNSLSPGSGPVTIDANVIQANLANDDGGGIRLLQVSGSNVSQPGRIATPTQVRNALGTIDITNNTIANNVSAHEGGGLALDDAVFVNVVNNTIAKNLTTATAVTSDGQPAPAGLSTGPLSLPLRARLLNNNVFNARASILKSTTYGKPTLFNDIFSDNRAGTFDGGTVTGITAADAFGWDMGAADHSAQLSPTNSVLQAGALSSDVVASPTNKVGVDPGFTTSYDVGVSLLNLRTFPAFRQAVIVTQQLPPSLLGDYHLVGTASPAYGGGAASKAVVWGLPSNSIPPVPPFGYTVFAPSSDIDGNVRPSGVAPLVRYDIGSDQLTP